eukprot:gene6375-5308_t
MGALDPATRLLCMVSAGFTVMSLFACGGGVVVQVLRLARRTERQADELR